MEVLRARAFEARDKFTNPREIYILRDTSKVEGKKVQDTAY